MEDEEFEKAKRFLNEKKIPTSKEILNLFFNGLEDNIQIMDDDDFKSIDFDSLGEADEVKTVSGTEWIASQLLWNTSKGPICSINLIKIEPFNPLTDPFEIMNGLYSDKKFYPSDDIIDIEYKDVNPLSFKEQLELAIENEDFEEAARLRDWDMGLKDLLLKLKPSIIKAVNDNDDISLDNYLTEIRNYRNTL